MTAAEHKCDRSAVATLTASKVMSLADQLCVLCCMCSLLRTMLQCLVESEHSEQTILCRPLLCSTTCTSTCSLLCSFDRASSNSTGSNNVQYQRSLLNAQ